MEVILLERVEKLGQIGDVVTVKNGFARNYLLPRNKALRANEANRKLFEANKAKIVADNDAKRKDAEAASKGIDGASVTLIRQASKMRSITPLEMSRKFKVDRKRACYELWWAALSGKIRLHDGRVFIAFKKEPGVYVIKELLEERAW